MNEQNRNFEWFFRAISYGVAVTGLFSLFTSGTIGIIITLLFLLLVVVAWCVENSRWQLSERVGVITIFIFVPLFYLDWKYQITGLNTKEAIAAGNLARLILILAGIKLLQYKSNRDWVFIYLISFFEVLLAAGSSISPLFLASLVLYLLFAVCSVIAFEIRKSAGSLVKKNKNNQSVHYETSHKASKDYIFRLPYISIGLLIFIGLFAVPLFFAFPRVGGTGFGNNFGGLSGFTGFSDSVRLGEIGKLQQNDEIVMRVRLEEGDRDKIKNFRWRGVALDSFDNHNWRKSKVQYSEPFVKTERDFFVVDTAVNTNRIVTQTIYLEPIDTSVLFTLSRPIAIQGNFQILTKDVEGAITVPNSSSERTNYKVFSDVAYPSAERLQADNTRYSMQSQRYLKLPDEIDERIGNLAQEVISQTGGKNRYDQAKAVENYLQTNFGYTLELKASGEEPLSDFLFNVREGHCEYFATAMAIMLRTQGIATRVVNGFQQGEYNETADIYVVRQKDAHSWVEVYFPKENVWIPFDPTPPAGRFPEQTVADIGSRFSKFVEALETFWIQYIVSYDTQEQRSLFRSVKKNFSEYQTKNSSWLKNIQNSLGKWWVEARGDKGLETSVKAVGVGILYISGAICGVFFLVWLIKKLTDTRFWEKLKVYLRRDDASIVEFYERMVKILESRGFRRESHQTPLEFAYSVSIPQAVNITEKYNRVRFSEKNLTPKELTEIEEWLRVIRDD